MGVPLLQRLHPFDLAKYQRAWSLLVKAGAVTARPTLRPFLPGPGELLKVHTPEYLESLRRSESVAAILEVPQVAAAPIGLLDRLVLRPMRWACGGTVVAARAALARGWAINLGGGFHHAGPDRGEGFCVYNDIALATRAVRGEGRVARVMVIDLDAHQGNGVERFALRDSGLAVLDLYNGEIYPGDEEAKRAIRWDLPVPCGTGDREYLSLVREAVPAALEEHAPEFVFYNAGTDILRGDAVGMLDVTFDGVLERDRVVLSALSARGVPWVMVTSGGYTEQSHRLIAETAKWALRTLPVRGGPDS